MKSRKQNILPIEDLMYSREGFSAPGSVFRLSENSFIRKLEQLAQLMPGAFEIRESSGIHQLFLLEDIQHFLPLRDVGPRMNMHVRKN